eukprot:6349024-Prymnesium_polylepis.1
MPSRHKRCRALVLHWERSAIKACRCVAWGWCKSAEGGVHVITCRLAGLLVRQRLSCGQRVRIGVRRWG